MRGLIMKSTNSSATPRDASRQVHTTASPNWTGVYLPAGVSSMIRTLPAVDRIRAVDDANLSLPRYEPNSLTPHYVAHGADGNGFYTRDRAL